MFKLSLILLPSKREDWSPILLPRNVGWSQSLNLMNRMWQKCYYMNFENKHIHTYRVSLLDHLPWGKTTARSWAQEYVWGETPGRNWGLPPTTSTNFPALWMRHLEITTLHLLKSLQDDNWLQTLERLWGRTTHLSHALILTHRISEDNNYCCVKPLCFGAL